MIRMTSDREAQKSAIQTGSSGTRTIVKQETIAVSVKAWWTSSSLMLFGRNLLGRKAEITVFTNASMITPSKIYLTISSMIKLPLKGLCHILQDKLKFVIPIQSSCKTLQKCCQGFEIQKV